MLSPVMNPGLVYEGDLIENASGVAIAAILCIWWWRHEHGCWLIEDCGWLCLLALILFNLAVY